jgi:20S proteasome subunit alpha 4
MQLVSSTLHAISLPSSKYTRLTQKYTQSGGVRPFGISTLIIGFDYDKVPKLYQTDPSGIYSAWKANAIGRSSKTVREFLELNYKEKMTRDESVKLAIRSLLEIVQTGAKNIEIVVMDKDGVKSLESEEVEAVSKQIEVENAAEVLVIDHRRRRRQRRGPLSGNLRRNG